MITDDDDDDYSGEEGNFNDELAGNMKEVSVECIATRPSQCYFQALQLSQIELEKTKKQLNQAKQQIATYEVGGKKKHGTRKEATSQGEDLLRMVAKSFAVDVQPWLERSAFDEVARIMKDPHSFDQIRADAMYESFEKWKKFVGLRLYRHIKSKAADDLLVTVLASGRQQVSTSKFITTRIAY